jgi:hypothetical protein
MPPRSSKFVVIGTIIALAALAAGVGVFFLLQKGAPAPYVPTGVATSTREVIGTSVEGRAIEAYAYGSGDVSLVFVGGIHGGYEWNSVLLAYELMDYLAEDPARVPGNLRVVVIPSANPDGVYKIVGKEGRFALADVKAGDQSPGRFNANGVDLNRNFDCKWQSEAMWRGNKVGAGTQAFSEPEAKALRDFFLKERPAAAVFYHSQANAVYASECNEGVLPETLAVMNAYASAAGYPAIASFDAYPITGDAEGWLASIGIPALSVELATHESVEWGKNRLGIEALLARYGK